MGVAVSDYWRFFMGLFFGFLRSFSAIGPSCTNKEPKKKPDILSSSSRTASYGMYSFWLIIAGILLLFLLFSLLFSLLGLSEMRTKVATFAAASFFLMLTVLTIILQLCPFVVLCAPAAW